MSNLDKDDVMPIQPGFPPVCDAMREVFCLDKGQVIFQYPSSITKAEYEDLKSWMDLVLRKLERRSDHDDDAKKELGL